MSCHLSSGQNSDGIDLIMMVERTYLARLANQGVVDKKKSKKKKKKKSKDPAKHIFLSERLCVSLFKQSLGPTLVGEKWNIGRCIKS